ncbi:MAG: serine/threonine protein kinase [Pyrinomonadaceae bacterium]|nr:serine/threonine protein kinase [Pyrinomonadaceae bacterium]
MKELALQNCRLDDRYDLLRLLGRGSYAEIYVGLDNRAANDSPNRTVVIKALNVLLQEEPDDDLERTLIENFQNEAVALDRVHHPNIISRLGHGTARDLRGTVFHYLVLEYLPGGDLAEMNKKQPFAFELMLRYIEQVCAGLDYAHRQKIIHRDIKPHNLLLTKNRQVVKIADFGVAKLADDDSPITRVGTNVYAAPEHSPLMTGQISSTKLTPAADVYSLAKTVYALLVGRSPREFSNAPISGLPQNLADKPWAKGIVRVLERATQNEPLKRHQNVGDFWQELYQVKLALEIDLPTQVAARVTAPLAASNVPGFSPQTPVLPKFDSMPNVQTKPVNIGTLQQNPRPVIETEARQHQPLPRNNQVNLPVNIPNDATRQPQIETAKVPSSVRVPAANQSKIGSGVKPFFQRTMLRLAVVLILLGAFSAVLGGTYNYLQTSGWFLTIFSQKVVATKDAWLRDAPNGNKVNLVTENSDLRVYGKSSDGNWYNVEIVRQAEPDKATSTVTRGYVGKTVVDIK